MNTDLNKLYLMLNYLNSYELNQSNITPNIKYDLINLFMKNDLLNILCIYIKYQKNINNIVYNNTSKILNIYELFTIICNYIFNLVCISNDKYNISNELSFIFDVYNLPSNNLYLFINNSITISKNSSLFFYNIKITFENYDQKLIFIFENDYIHIKNIAIVNNIIGNTLQLIEYNSNLNIIIDNLD
jgi:hypothetical protein